MAAVSSNPATVGLVPEPQAAAPVVALGPAPPPAAPPASGPVRTASLTHPRVRRQIPRVPASDVEAVRAFLREEFPVVITESNLVAPAVQKWTPQYLATNLPNSAKFAVYRSKNLNFRFWHAERKVLYYRFQPPTEKMDMSFQQFYKILRAHPSCGRSYAPDQRVYFDPTPEPRTDPDKKEAKHVDYFYLQQQLHSEVGEVIKEDFCRFDFRWIADLKQRNGWGPLTMNLLLVGMPGVTTPAHYDEQENMFAQVRGRKRFLLFPPTAVDGMYPYPVAHPHDRQSQVDVEDPDLDRHPTFAQVEAMETVLGPGELVYIPAHWWHHVVSLDETVSVNFWFKTAPFDFDRLALPLPPNALVLVARNIERLIANAVPWHLLRRALCFSSDVPLRDYKPATARARAKQVERCTYPPPEASPESETAAVVPTSTAVPATVTTPELSFNALRDLICTLVEHVMPGHPPSVLLRLIVSGRYDVSNEFELEPPPHGAESEICPSILQTVAATGIPGVNTTGGLSTALMLQLSPLLPPSPAPLPVPQPPPQPQPQPRVLNSSDPVASALSRLQLAGTPRSAINESALVDLSTVSNVSGQRPSRRPAPSAAPLPNNPHDGGARRNRLAARLANKQATGTRG